MFLKWLSMGSDVHVTKSEIEEAFKVCRVCVQNFGCNIACLAVDNAAKKIAEGIADKLENELGCKVLVLWYVSVHLFVSDLCFSLFTDHFIIQ